MTTPVDSVILIPPDAGEYADQLLDLLEHIPVEWGRHLRVSKGWYPLIVKTHQLLLELDPDYEAYQVKEKFGGLRFYHGLSAGIDSSLGWAVEVAAEIESYQICEECGQPGTLHKDTSYWQTLCEPCFEARQLERAERGLV
jgi:hypothetical protein